MATVEIATCGEILPFGRSQGFDGVQPYTRDSLVAAISKKQRERYYDKQRKCFIIGGTSNKTERLVFTSLGADAAVYHHNYLQYLDLCWATHNGVVLTPDLLWFTIMNEVAAVVTAKPEDFRSLFTRSPDVVEVRVASVPTDPNFLNDFIAKLRDLVPLNVDTFLPDFSTSDNESRIALASVFLETVAPYYALRGGCGIPRVRVEGTADDWRKLERHLMMLHLPFSEAAPSLAARIQKLAELTANIAAQVESGQFDAGFWKSMFHYGALCMSGHWVENSTPEGWFVDIFGRKGAYAGDYPHHITRVPFKLDGPAEYSFRSGVFSAGYDDAQRLFLRPRFAHMVFVEDRPAA
eukprot:gnl/Hemi2/20256_TR6719_c0_g1_i1.p1 gnl/Hemi2/20256_TR6719_c0_g1~~gnl/Hemi2/20256_TR6719_c0_g1_i1.p1  ORF type:complete len:351 (-),score=127.86 gnl/Hemi2/20256_TR6719_c0_g1_i1:142-1194(-)